MYDVVVVGAGSAGCALAGRLAARTGRSVLLLEAGPGGRADPDVGSLAATAPGHPRNWAHPVELAPGVAGVVPRGRGVGGSAAINAAVWTYVTPADAAGWAVPGWSYPSMRYWYAIAEREAIFATEGPVPVQVPSGALLHPTAERFLVAAAALGFAEEPDKNAGGPPGAGLVPSNSRDGLRIDPARAYLPTPLPLGAQRLTVSPASRHGESRVSTRRVGRTDTLSGAEVGDGVRSGDPGAATADIGRAVAPTGAGGTAPNAAGADRAEAQQSGTGLGAAGSGGDERTGAQDVARVGAEEEARGARAAASAGGGQGGAAASGGVAEGDGESSARAGHAAPWPGLGTQGIAEPRAPVVRTDTTVERVLIEGGRAVGVELAGGERVLAHEVVLCAGAIGTPRLLLRSGLGPAATLRAVGVEVLHDLPDVGRGFTDHPAVFLPFRVDDPPPHPHAPTAQAALHWDAGADPAGDVEVLLFTRPFTPGGDLHLMCALQQPDSRGALDLERVAYDYLRTEHDRRRLRHAIRTAADLLRAGLGARTDPDGDVLGNDRALDAWVAAHLATAVHLCGSAALGRVVDADLRVLGVDGLRVADTSVLPLVPRRGPAATAIAIGEKAAALLAVDRP